MKNTLAAILESTESLLEIAPALKDHEETKRALAKVGRESKREGWRENMKR